MAIVRFGKGLRARISWIMHRRGNPQFDPRFSELVDLSQVEMLAIAPEQALQLADEIDPFLPAAKGAFVVQSVTSNYAPYAHVVAG